MTIVGFHASHEQVHPGELLRAVQHAEQVGFDAAMCSDHFAPWGLRQGHSGFAWSWLGAALATTGLSFGVVNAPGQRYHPAIIAQAAATLAAMFPERFWVAVGSGENVNEHITGDAWPPKHDREQRMLACVDVIRRLFAGEEVSQDGPVRVDRARLWTRPDVPPPLLAAAISPETATRGGGWADGLVTASQPPDALRRVLTAYRESGGTGPALLQVHVSWAPTDEEAAAIARDQWRHGLISPPDLWDIASPAEFDRRTENASADQVRETLFVSSDVGAHLAHLSEFVHLGFDGVYLHHVGQDQHAFLDVFGAQVLPELKKVSA
ncbi:TIGR03885 family FMN-dependent LLM class oxidoreductase [Rathayibacter sp. YIM 133350]|uniref:TIGR03885 family FMN-dependent LLM class oxidoreductase n=1 Tax=Rathayibacter sp. YIM 133350 TaxID=3131992 RepID=UPI00307FB6A8